MDNFQGLARRLLNERTDFMRCWVDCAFLESEGALPFRGCLGWSENHGFRIAESRNLAILLVSDTII